MAGVATHNGGRVSAVIIIWTARSISMVTLKSMYIIRILSLPQLNAGNCYFIGV